MTSATVCRFIVTSFNDLCTDRGRREHRWRGPKVPSHAAADPAAQPTARQVLDQRYANGDIDEEEYQRRLRGLVE